jgi:cobalt-zinc-cadmium efflux system membrane fusion protein
MTSRLLPLLLAAGALAGEGHAHGPQPGAAQVGPVVLGPEALGNLGLRTVRAEVRPLAREVELGGSLRASSSAHAVLAPAVAARVLEARVLPGARLAAGDAVLVLQPLVAGAGKVTLAAPLAGTLLGQLPPAGSVVQAGQALAEVADLADLAVRGRAMSQPLPPLAPGQPVVVRLGDRALKGEVRAVSPAPDTPLPAMDYEIRVAGAMPSDLGAAARVGVRVGQPAPAIAVPLAAVVGEPGREAVFVQTEPRTFERRAVALGHREAGWVEIVRGVLPGETVVTRGAYQLQFAGAAAAPAGDHGHGH